MDNEKAMVQLIKNGEVIFKTEMDREEMRKMKNSDSCSFVFSDNKTQFIIPLDMKNHTSIPNTLLIDNIMNTNFKNKKNE